MPRAQRCAFALLPRAEAQNEARELSYALHRSNPGRMRWITLPPHVSLKQPFEYERLAPLETCLGRLSESTAPVTAVMERVEVRPPPPQGNEQIAWVAVAENPVLRAMHERLLRELPLIVLDPVATFDGDTYRFHMTLGFMRDEASVVVPAEAARVDGQTITFDRIAMFLYDGFPPETYQYMTYRVLPLLG